MIHRLSFFLLLWVSTTQLPAQSENVGFQPFVRSIQSTEKSLEIVHLKVKLQRIVALKTEKSDANKGEKIWATTLKKRQRIDSRFKKLAKKLPRISSIKPTDAPELAVRLLSSWVKRSDAVTIRKLVDKDLPEFRKILSRQISGKKRRDFLHVVCSRQSQVPGVSDLDVLIEVILWEDFFFPPAKPKTNHLDTVSIDLILLFTDRGADGISQSGEKYYVASRFLADGFRDDLKDKSNQVRHFCWAWRMFMKSRNPAAIRSLLYFKEIRDSKTRKLPMNKADLRLNKCAGLIAKTVKNNGDPMSIIGTAAVMRKVLGKDTLVKPSSKKD